MDSCTIYAETALASAKTAQSLTSSWYTTPCTVLLSGELGAGKTTFLQAWFASIGVDAPVTSPTFALEQRYPSKLGPIAHVDLYRLTEPQAKELLHATEDFAGIRCIEWPERASKELLQEQPQIHLSFREKGLGREIEFRFNDLPLPSREEVMRWRNSVRLPAHIATHCDAVAALAEELAHKLIKRGTIVRPLALKRAGELHDLFRFVDFREGAGPEDVEDSKEDQALWASWEEKYPGKHHEAVCTAFLEERGFAALGRIIETHGLTNPPGPQATIEQKILYYADKRVRGGSVVTLDERFADFAVRYSNGQQTPEREQWMQEVKAMEEELFPR